MRPHPTWKCASQSSPRHRRDEYLLIENHLTLAVRSRRIQSHVGARPAIVALEQTLLIIASHMLKEGVAHEELSIAYYDCSDLERATQRLLRRMESLGNEPTSPHYPKAENTCFPRSSNVGYGHHSVHRCDVWHLQGSLLCRHMGMTGHRASRERSPVSRLVTADRLAPTEDPKGATHCLPVSECAIHLFPMCVVGGHTRP